MLEKWSFWVRCVFGRIDNLAVADLPHARSQALQRDRSFAVDDVAPERKRIWTEPLEKCIARRFRRRILLLPESTKPVINPLMDHMPNNLRGHDGIGGRWHPVIEAVHCAFSRHYPLTLSPDAIWLVIAQGFSHHINENAERFRQRFVRHEGRELLTAQLPDLTLDSFENAIADLSGQIRDATDAVLHETLLCDFTTTTPRIRTASEIVLMDTYRSYFEYGIDCVCGIPRINVTGTVEDWQRIRQRLEVLETYELGWWIARLRPIVDEFVRTVKGAPDREFWQAIYKPRDTYGATTVTGWIADLFPYLDDGPKRQRNHVFDHQRERWSVAVENGVETDHLTFDPEADKGPPLESFPSGLSSVPVTLSFPDGSRREVDLVAGYFAVEQNPADLSLSPVIMWAVTEPAPTTPILI
jgi:hypothetical protein